MTYNHIWQGMGFLDRVPLHPLLVPIIFTWLIVNGFYWTKNYNEFMKRLIIIACIAQPFYMYYFDRMGLNIVFTYIILMIVLKALDENIIDKYILIPSVVFIGLLVNIELAWVMLPLGILFYYIRPYVINKIMFLHKIRINKSFIRIYYPGHLLILSIIKYYLLTK